MLFRLLSATLLLTVAACASNTEAPAAAGSSDLSTSSLNSVLGQIEQRAGGHTYVVSEHFADADLPHGVPNALSGGARTAALADCAVYGGGAGGGDEDINKYIDASGRAELAGKLDSAIGDSLVYRINSFGIGDAGDDFSARCTVGVRVGPNDILMLQGHGRDSLL